MKVKRHRGRHGMKHVNRQITAGLTLAVATALAGCASGGTAVREAAPPVAPRFEAHAVYERLIEVTGGRAALERYASTRAVGEFSMPAQGLRGDLEVFAAAPNKLFIRVNIPGFGMVRNGFDGEVGWSINPAVGPMVLEGTMLEQMRQQADFLGPLNMQAYIDSARVVEEAEFAGKMCQKVRLVTKWGEEYFEFYDVATGLPVGVIRTQESPMGGVEATTVLSDFEDFGGILIPTTTVLTTMGVDQIITVTAVEFDTVDPSVFGLPKEIQALVKKE
jgi:hypothetical protein